MSDKQYVDQSFRRAVYMERLKRQMVNEFGLTIKEIDKVLRGLDVEELTVKQLDKYLVKIDDKLRKTLGVFGDNYREQLREIFLDSYDFEAKSLANAYPTLPPIVTPDAIATIATASLQKPMPLERSEGIQLDKLITNFEDKQVETIKSRIRMGHYEGKTNQQLVKELIGSRANKYKDGIVDVTRRQAEAIIRTGVQQVANDARLEIAKQNSDIVIGEQIIATLDRKTSLVCRSADGMVFKVGEGRRPPFHINCRSTFILVLDPKYRGKGNTDKRASYEGVTDNKSYYDWLKTQSHQFQDDVLGKVRGKLFRDGGLSSEDFAKLNVNNNYEPLTLKDMRSKDPIAFERAGL